MKLPKIFSAMATAAFLFATTTFAAPNTNTDGVNWTQNVITVTGESVVPENTVNYTQARALASRGARADAYRKMAEMINGVHVEGETTVEKMLTTQDTIKLRVEATIKGARVLEETFMSDGSYRVIMQVPLFGTKDSLADAVFDKNSTVEPFPEPVYEVDPSVQGYNSSTPVQRRIEITQQTKVTVEEKSLFPEPLPTPMPKPVKPPLSRLATSTIEGSLTNLQENVATLEAFWQIGQEQAAHNTAAAEPVRRSVADYASLAKGDYTGLIVDCRGLDLQPVMSPVIKNTNGTKIYGHKNLDIDRVIREGMAGYSDNTETVDRAGENPIVVKAVSVENFNSNPVLTIADSNRVLIENYASKFLKDLKVVFIFD